MLCEMDLHRNCKRRSNIEAGRRWHGSDASVPWRGYPVFETHGCCWNGCTCLV